MIRLRPGLIAVALATATAALYLPDLAGAPFYLNRDEMFFGLTAHSLATTGFDANGHYLPLYTQSPMRYGSEMWFQPALMYTAALSVKLAGLTEGTIRFPMTLFAIADIVLIYLIGRRLFRRELPAIACAFLLAVTPAHYIHSRVAMDFQAPLPFLLAWLLFALTYFETRRPAWLFAAGLSLGIGLYTYIAAYMWMPVYGMLTLIALFMRRESLNRHALFAAAFAIPALSGVPFLMAHPTVIRDVMWHYDREQPQTAGGADLFVTYFSSQRFLKAAGVYLAFWNPRFLLIDGPGALWAAGALLFPTAGLLIIGVVSLLKRRGAEAVLLLGGLFTAAIPASLVGDVDAIHRASAFLPFAVMVSIAGLDSLWTTRKQSFAAIAFVTVWVLLILLATQYHDYLPLAQAAIRASTMPLAIATLCAVLVALTPNAVGTSVFWLAALTTIGVLQVAFVAVGYATAAWTSCVVLGGWLVLKRTFNATDNRLAQVIAGVTIAVASSLFMAAHADYGSLVRIGPIPATAIVMALRAFYASLAVVTFGLIVRVMARDGILPASRSASVAVVVGVVVLQFAYFHVDRFTDVARSVHALAVFAGTAGIVAFMVGRRTLTQSALPLLTSAGLLGLASIQFGYFAHDYFTRYRNHAGHFDTEGNARVVWEEVLDESTRREVPRIYIASVGPYGFSDLYWQFYVTKHHREDLLARTAIERELHFDRIALLPPSSLVVTSPSPSTDKAISRMITSHELRSKRLVVAPDGRSKFWVLETGPGS